MGYLKQAENRCFFCMRSLNDNGQCTCSYSHEYTVHIDTLHSLRLHQERWLEGMVWEETKDGVLHIACDLQNDARVLLLQCNNKAPEEALEQFEENGQTWAVLPLSIRTLSARVQKEGPLSIKEANRILQNIVSECDAKHIEAQFPLLSPDTLFAGPDGILEYDPSGYELPLSGYTAPEYYRGNALSGASDCYAAAAVLYYAVTGITPPDAYERLVQDALIPPHELGASLSETEEHTLQEALSLSPESRYSFVQTSVSDAETTGRGKPSAVHLTRRHILSLSLLLVVALSLGLYLITAGHNDNPWREEESGASVIENEDITADMIRRIIQDEQTVSLELSQCSLSDAILEDIAKCSHINILRLDSCTGYHSLDMFADSSLSDLTLIQSEDIDGNTLLSVDLPSVTTLELITSPYCFFQDPDLFLMHFPSVSTVRIAGFEHLSDLSFAEHMPQLTALDLVSAEGSRMLEGISSAPLAACTELSILHADHTGLYDLSGLEDLASLNILSLKENGIRNLSPLKDHTALAYLDLSDNPIDDISPLAGNTSLATLVLNGTHITDLSALSNMQELAVLSAADTWIHSAEALRSIPALTALDLSRTYITDISFLEGHTELTSLAIHETGVSDLSPLSAMAKLVYLDAGRCALMSAHGLENCTNLYSLDLSRNMLSDLAPLEERTYPELRSLRIGFNGISDIHALANMPKLQDVAIEANRIYDLRPLEQAKDLRILIAYQNSFTDISFLPLQNVQYLDLGYTGITDIHVLSAMEKENTVILLDHCRIQDLTLPPHAPKRLDLYGNAIHDLSALASCTRTEGTSPSLGFTWHSGIDYAPVLRSPWESNITIAEMTDADKADILHKIVEAKGQDAVEPAWVSGEEADRLVNEFRSQSEDSFPLEEDTIVIGEVNNASF